ncbi:MAG: hypothetical protein RBG13Loki_1850 [Promethearchaeota archaeon CR_4]|nr:MAG: hypothetical protein RBG13Loki_1850 [Candidatus Lokiarchaeota archaeon CR_4]
MTEPDQILTGFSVFLTYLGEKGLQKEGDFRDETYPRAQFFRISGEDLLIVYELEPREDESKIKQYFIDYHSYGFLAIFEINQKISFFRLIGDSKKFVFSLQKAERMSKIDKIRKIGENINFLFDMKDISKDFYSSFQELRELFASKIQNTEISDSEKQYIAQKFFNRIFFVYFLCHKRVVRHEDGRSISGGSLFTGILMEEDHFLQALLRFFSHFNQSDAGIFVCREHRLRIPFLNGGLFRIGEVEKRLSLNMSKESWVKIFDFLGSYNWIIEDPGEGEESGNSLTPEILGHVYERSVIGWTRNEMGVYYTPEDISSFLCINSIIPYVLENTVQKYDTLYDLLENGNLDDLSLALKRLEEVRILDPACGSGSLLIKACEHLLLYRRRLMLRIASLGGEDRAIGELRSTEFDFQLKYNIITENIYGVDILPGAVEITQLRLWLWLIEEYEGDEEILPLPNIEYNIRVGNSLIGWLDEYFAQGIGLFAPLADKRIRGIFEGLVAFSDGEDRKNLERCQYLLSQVQGDVLKGYIEAYSIFYRIYRSRSGHGRQGESLKEILEALRDRLYNLITPTYANFINSKYKPGFNPQHPPIGGKDLFQQLMVFHWNVDFGPIINRGEGGFDLIIANPPYGDLLQDTEKKIISHWATVSSREIVANFVERIIRLLRVGGHISLIVTNGIAINDTAAPARQLLRENFPLSRMVLFGSRPGKVFADAEIRVMLLYGRKSPPPHAGLIETTNAIKFYNEQRHTILDHLSFASTEGIVLGQSRIGGGEDVALPKVGSKIARNILLKLRNQSETTVADRLKDTSQHAATVRITGGYWLNALRHFPYEGSSKLKAVHLETEVERDFLILLVNSNLFYFFWDVYGNLRDFKLTDLGKFPFPPNETLSPRTEQIKNHAIRLERCLNSTFEAIQDGQGGRKGEFSPGFCKPLIDEIEVLLGSLYNLTPEEISWLCAYDSVIRKNLHSDLTLLIANLPRIIGQLRNMTAENFREEKNELMKNIDSWETSFKKKMHITNSFLPTKFDQVKQKITVWGHLLDKAVATKAELDRSN